jgi:hypothetical protein
MIDFAQAEYDLRYDLKRNRRRSTPLSVGSRDPRRNRGAIDAV